MRLRLLLVVSVMLACLIGSVLPAAARYAGESEVVTFGGYQPGTIVIRTAERHLYFVVGAGQAIRYPIAVGRPGKEWAGATFVARKVVNPIWSPPEEVRRDSPNLPELIPPGPRNPLGPRALVLATGEYAIHGTNNADSIGTKASYGCIRMYNQHILDLYDRVSVGTPVVVVR
ncbi:MAG: L,D-transpeptidase [Ancalomicrobiaceae bacterium]|nr:L,D-transpeptidase [Ancalomicrobiaceae bacterium]